MAVIRFDEADDLIDICMDNVFKAVFARNTPESLGGALRPGVRSYRAASDGSRHHVERTGDRQLAGPPDPL
ncbi:MAG: hypothetical protein LBD58_09070 [Treponema sp.]|nr:hypothetical protein [Treponema sp.]